MWNVRRTRWFSSGQGEVTSHDDRREAIQAAIEATATWDGVELEVGSVVVVATYWPNARQALSALLANCD